MDDNDNLKIIIRYYLKRPLIGTLNNVFWIETEGVELPVFQIIGSMTPNMNKPEVILESKDYSEWDKLLNNKRKLTYEIPSKYRKYYIDIRIVQDAHRFKVIPPRNIDRFIERRDVIHEDICLYCYEKFACYETISKCPFCGEPIPKQLRKEPNKRIIGLAGCTSSGKTVYLGILIKTILAEIATGNRPVFNHPLVIGNTKEEFENYENFKLLFEENKMPKMNAPIQDELPPPLIYVLRRKKRKIIGSKHVTYILAFYETAGEFLTRESSIDTAQRHLAQAKGLIFLMDISSPNQIKKSKDGLVNLINNIQKVRYDGDFNVKIKIPISFAFTKFDTYFYKLKIQHSIFRNPPVTPTIKQLNLISELFEQFLIKKTQNTVREMIISTIGMIEDSFSDYRFFPVSAIGYEPKEKVIDRAIEPYMIVYPLLNLMR